ncbi:hypothetical protein OF829_11860 [Sphingomonas sp. LB-2]|uniref:hypothetical protein n=1 Tax=Sphingomonas caeni TaxID=2984949 RepID=UPI0022324083|nr:hypothetical protein [Sphingomonas caeni]MCW3847936.1 hypothetical protein [Sphingomonas caeni]
MRRVRHQTYAQSGRGYRPARAWLGSPGDGVPLRARRSPAQRWGFRWTQLRILLLALLIAALAWPLVLALPGGTH